MRQFCLTAEFNYTGYHLSLGAAGREADGPHWIPPAHKDSLFAASPLRLRQTNTY